MPVVISYQPVGAIAQAATNVFNTEQAARRPAPTGPAWIDDPAPPTSGGESPQQAAYWQNVYTQDQNNPNRYYAGPDHDGVPSAAPGGGGRAAAAMQTYTTPAGTQMGTDEGTGTFDPETGQMTGQTDAPMPAAPKSYRVTPQQKVQLQNLEQTGATGDAYQQNMRQILGLPEPTIDLTMPDGTKVPIAQSKYPAVKEAMDKQIAQQKIAADDLEFKKSKEANDNAISLAKRSQGDQRLAAHPVRPRNERRQGDQ